MTNIGDESASTLHSLSLSTEPVRSRAEELNNGHDPVMSELGITMQLVSFILMLTRTSTPHPVLNSNTFSSRVSVRPSLCSLLAFLVFEHRLIRGD